MIIKQAKQDIKFFKRAIENAQAVVELQVNKNEEYQEFEEKYANGENTVLFFPHIMSFSFYNFRTDDKKDYFEIKDGEIIYLKNSSDIENIEEIAEKLLSIVGKFYV